MREMRLVVAGASGRMGKMLIKAIYAHPDLRLAGALVSAGSSALGQDAGALTGIGPVDIDVTSDPLQALLHADGLIDFTRPDVSVELAALAAQTRIVHVIGTTGFDERQSAALSAAARHCVQIRSGNMSIGIQLLAAAVRKLAAALGPQFDIEIVEMHHRGKVDAPSGTALLLGEAAAKGQGVALKEHIKQGRAGMGARQNGEIGFASLRAGTVVGDHSVVFAGPFERLELTHRAEDRSIFANGAVRAAQWGWGRKPGLYEMEDVLDLK